MFNAALGRLLEFLRQDCCFAREDVQRLLQIELRTLCPHLSSHFALVAQLEASAGVMTQHHLHEDHPYNCQHQVLIPPPDACPWAIVRSRLALLLYHVIVAVFAKTRRNNCHAQFVLSLLLYLLCICINFSPLHISVNVYGHVSHRHHCHHQHLLNNAAAQ